MSSTNSKIALALLSILALLFAALFAYGLQYIRTLNEETSRQSQRVDKAAAEEDLARSILEVQANASSEISEFESIVLSDNELVSVIESIEDAGRDLGLKTGIVSVDKIGEAEKFQEIKIVIETEGSWASTLSFLKALEELPHQVSVQKTNIIKGETLWHSDITLSLYSFN